ncbi:MAG TPA: acyl-CoA dehydrogenase family protein [Chloroflexota bacterium]|nr:acyl-CoA dehydrogenase family protein [Chloroflexota bacterium]
MYARIQAARQLIWRAAWEADRGGPEGARLGWVAKAFASDVALWVTQKAVLTFGGRGIMEDYPVEKLARDALAYHHMHGTNDALRLKTAASLAVSADATGDGALGDIGCATRG